MVRATYWQAGHFSFAGMQFDISHFESDLDFGRKVITSPIDRA